MLFTARLDGALDAWDLLTSWTTPASTCQVSYAVFQTLLLLSSPLLSWLVCLVFLYLHLNLSCFSLSSPEPVLLPLYFHLYLSCFPSIFTCTCLVSPLSSPTPVLFLLYLHLNLFSSTGICLAPPPTPPKSISLLVCLLVSPSHRPCSSTHLSVLILSFSPSASPF